MYFSVSKKDFTLKGCCVCLIMAEDVGLEPLPLLPKQVCYRYTTSSILVEPRGIEPLSKIPT